MPDESTNNNQPGYDDDHDNGLSTPLARRITKLESLTEFQESLKAVKLDKSGNQAQSSQPVVAKDHTAALL